MRGNNGGNSEYWSDFLLPLIIDRDYVMNTYSFYKNGDINKKLLNYKKEFNNFDVQHVRDLDRSQFPMLSSEIYQSFMYYISYVYNIQPNQESIKFQGNIYLLVDRYVYSASEAFAVFVKNVNLATLIGEKTSGDGIGHDPWIEMLPNSGFLFRFSMDLATTSDGTINEEHKTTPHYEIDLPKKHKLFKYDLCVQKVLELEGLESAIN
ncbi:S41 family peptidase [Alkaliphilus pronyensis]|uniref:S41 family peptidase n=1 Tax=Alkaliphilus pronyensis TaxID=1482732 RepID=UPI001FAB10F4|nr:S41 family peptidase [Alkaliphilus pronyensis]